MDNLTTDEIVIEDEFIASEIKHQCAIDNSGEICNFIVNEDGKLTYRLTNFEGPLDLLLFLIKGSKLDIYDIKLADITGQYLKYMEQISEIEMERASEFIEIAATLIEIKSKHLLPKPEDEAEEEDEETKLLKRLREYKIFKEASDELKQNENTARFYKEPEKDESDYKVVLKNFSFDKLISAFTSMLAKAEVKAVVPSIKEVKKDRFTITDKIKDIKTILKSHSSVSFFSLFDENFYRSEIITTFMAILELLKMEQIKVSQQHEFDDIIILKSESFCEDKIIFEDVSSMIEIPDKNEEELTEILENEVIDMAQTEEVIV